MDDDRPNEKELIRIIIGLLPGRDAVILGNLAAASEAGTIYIPSSPADMGTVSRLVGVGLAARAVYGGWRCTDAGLAVGATIRRYMRQMEGETKNGNV